MTGLCLAVQQQSQGVPGMKTSAFVTSGTFIYPIPDIRTTHTHTELESPSLNGHAVQIQGTQILPPFHTEGLKLYFPSLNHVLHGS